MCFKYFIALCLGICCFLFSSVFAIPKYESNNEIAYANTHMRNQPYFKDNKTVQEEDVSTKDRLQRLGYSTGYGTINSYPGSSGLAGYSPIKLDLGGVVLGTLVGIGAIIIIPKILSAFHGGYSGYGRSEDENGIYTFSNFINKFDDILGQNNIDSTSCMQRAVCTYVRSTEYNIKVGVADQIDKFIHILSENSILDYMLDGTAIKEALAHGKKTDAEPCDEFYINCPVDSQKVTNMLKNMLPKKEALKANVKLNHI